MGFVPVVVAHVGSLGEDQHPELGAQLLDGLELLHHVALVQLPIPAQENKVVVGHAVAKNRQLLQRLLHDNEKVIRAVVQIRNEPEEKPVRVDLVIGDDHGRRVKVQLVSVVALLVRPHRDVSLAQLIRLEAEDDLRRRRKHACAKREQDDEISFRVIQQLLDPFLVPEIERQKEKLAEYN